MPFNSFGYLLVFLPAAALVYSILQKHVGHRWPQAWLLVASLLFYSQAKLSYLPILLVSIAFNWITVRSMMAGGSELRQKRLLYIGLLVNVAFLCSFKYPNLFLRLLPPAAGFQLLVPDWELPLGISFFTLNQVMYLVDTFEGLNAPSSLFDHATFVSFFPYVISGPLVRAREVVSQFHADLSREVRWEMAFRGLNLFAWGLAKKVILADTFSTIADVGFGSMSDYSTAEAWIVALAYTFQIYFDFSGYSDMALGSAWIMGIDIPVNFNAPYRAESISEFWRRWHISLSNFITHYLYTPILRRMGKATLRTSAIATLLAMGIAGMWHGSAWTYLVWGLLHGAALAVNQVWKRRKLKMPGWLGLAVTFVFVSMTFVIFRSRDVAFALHLLMAMLPHGKLFAVSEALRLVLPPLSPRLVVHPVAIGIAVAFLFRTSTEMARAVRPTFAASCVTAGLLLLSMLYMNSTAVKPFVYFAF